MALEHAGGVEGLEDFGIGTCAVWGRDVCHLRPGSFMVGRRDFLLSKTVGAGELKEGQCYLEGPNKHPEMTLRVNDKVAGHVSRFLAATTATWQAGYTYPNGDRTWSLDAATIAKLGKSETRTWPTDGRRSTRTRTRPGGCGFSRCR